jgi:hypothetical protein
MNHNSNNNQHRIAKLKKYINKQIKINNLTKLNIFYRNKHHNLRN